MSTPLHSLKLRNEHMTRPALVYVRQSTLMQVRDNTASTPRQYHLAQRAQDLGWPAHLVVVIDKTRGVPGPPALAGTALSISSPKSAWGGREPSCVWKRPAWPVRAATGIASLRSVP